MSDSEALLRAVIASPDDSLPRLVYADWLEEQGDGRAELLRSNWDASHLSFVDWLAERGLVQEYLQTHPELSGRQGERAVNERWRASLRALAGGRDENWVAVIDTLGRPFRPFYFWNNTGPRAFADGELPFREPLGSRGPVVTFESEYRGSAAWLPGLAEDLGFLHRLRLGDCASGAAACPMHPFVCELPRGSDPPTGEQILRGLHASDFRSRHTPRLDVAAIPYPGYHAYSDNDEIHTDPSSQYLFPDPRDLPGGDFVDESADARAAHDALRRAVSEGVLWYVVLHSRARDSTLVNGRCSWVVLFAVGRSLRGERLLGVVSHQMCHNLCD